MSADSLLADYPNDGDPSRYTLPQAHPGANIPGPSLTFLSISTIPAFLPFSFPSVCLPPLILCYTRLAVMYVLNCMLCLVLVA